MTRVRASLKTFAVTACCVLLGLASASARDWEGSLKEEFHHTYTLSPNGRVELDNINGPVHITAWDRNEVQVDAIKSANTQERLQEAQIEVEANANTVSIRTRYPDHNLTFNDWGHNNPASVEYTLKVPRAARLDEIKLINGALDVQGVTGEVRANCINGHLTANDLPGDAKLSTINGRLEVSFNKIGSSVELSSVNGHVEAVLPSDANTRFEASTVSGSIHDDFNLPVNHHRYVGQNLDGQLGEGASRLKLNNVNGSIEIRRANDNRPLSPAKSLNRGGKDDDRDDDDEI
jgi:hypothetical protein